MSDTLETDALRVAIDHGAAAEAEMTSLARQLEGERDEANKELHKQLVKYDALFDEAEKIRIERDEARYQASRYRKQ